MQNQSKESITYSNKQEGKATAYIITCLFGVPALMFLGIGAYLASIDGDWWVMLLFTPFTVILGFFAYMFFPRKQKHIYEYTLTNEGLQQRWINVETGDEEEHLISFSEVDYALIALYADRIPVPNHESFYRYNALLTLMYQGEYFFKRFIDPDELQEWITRLEGNVAKVHYADVDVSQAFLAQSSTSIDFSEVPGTSADVVSPHVGVETRKHDLEVWKPVGMMEEVENAQVKQTIPQTRKAEKRTGLLLFIYNILFLAIVLPDTPVDEKGIIELTNAILVGYMIVNLLIPTLLVFWRSFTKWYLPVHYTIITLVSNTIIAYAILLLQDFTFNFVTIIMLNIFNFVLWTGAMISIKVLKTLFIFINNQRTI